MAYSLKCPSASTNQLFIDLMRPKKAGNPFARLEQQYINESREKGDAMTCSMAHSSEESEQR